MFTHHFRSGDKDE
jgi:hypothetical protein